MIGILSFPRSGNHFVRYIVEYLTGRATIGCTEKLLSSPNGDSPICCRSGPKFLEHVSLENPIACKFHFANNSIKSYIPIGDTEKIIFIVRHPIETWASHRYKNHKEIFSNLPLSENLLKLAKKDKENFLNNLDFYTNYQGEKICIFYEDLVSQTPREPIEKIVKFLNLSQSCADDFVDNIEKFRADSMSSTHRKPISSTSKRSCSFYSDKMHPKTLDFLKSIFSSVLSHSLISKKYGEK